jgi:hypothetical protein
MCLAPNFSRKHWSGLKVLTVGKRSSLFCQRVNDGEKDIILTTRFISILTSVALFR